jgi:hypothetical protein
MAQSGSSPMRGFATGFASKADIDVAALTQRSFMRARPGARRDQPAGWIAPTHLFSDRIERQVETTHPTISLTILTLFFVFHLNSIT